MDSPTQPDNTPASGENLDQGSPSGFRAFPKPTKNKRSLQTAPKQLELSPSRPKSQAQEPSTPTSGSETTGPSKRASTQQSPQRTSAASNIQFAHGSVHLQVVHDSSFDSIRSIPDFPPAVLNQFQQLSLDLNLLVSPDWEFHNTEGYMGLFQLVGQLLSTVHFKFELEHFFTRDHNSAQHQTECIACVTKALDEFKSDSYKKKDDSGIFCHGTLHLHMCRIFDHFLVVLKNFTSFAAFQTANSMDWSGIADGNPFPHYLHYSDQLQVLQDLLRAFDCPTQLGLQTGPLLVKLVPGERSLSHFSDVFCSGSWIYKDMCPTVTVDDLCQLRDPIPLVVVSPDLQTLQLYNASTLARANIDSDCDHIFASLYGADILAEDPLFCQHVSTIVDSFGELPDFFDRPPILADIIANIIAHQLLPLSLVNPIALLPSKDEATDEDVMLAQPTDITLDTFPDAMTNLLRDGPDEITYDEFTHSLLHACWAEHVRTVYWTAPRHLPLRNLSTLAVPLAPTGSPTTQETGHSTRQWYTDHFGRQRGFITNRGGALSTQVTSSWASFRLYSGLLLCLRKNININKFPSIINQDFSSSGEHSTTVRRGMFVDISTLRTKSQLPGSFHLSRAQHQTLAQKLQPGVHGSQDLPPMEGEDSPAFMLEQVRGLMMSALTPQSLDHHGLYAKIQTDMDVLLTVDFIPHSATSEIIHAWHIRKDPTQSSHSPCPSQRPARTEGAFCLEVNLQQTAHGLDIWIHTGEQVQGLRNAASPQAPPRGSSTRVHFHPPKPAPPSLQDFEVAGSIVSGFHSLQDPALSMERFLGGLFSLNLSPYVDVDSLTHQAYTQRPPEGQRQRSVHYSAGSLLPAESTGLRAGMLLSDLTPGLDQYVTEDRLANDMGVKPCYSFPCSKYIPGTSYTADNWLSVFFVQFLSAAQLAVFLAPSKLYAFSIRWMLTGLDSMDAYDLISTEQWLKKITKVEFVLVRRTFALPRWMAINVGTQTGQTVEKPQNHAELEIAIYVRDQTARTQLQHDLQQNVTDPQSHHPPRYHVLTSLAPSTSQGPRRDFPLLLSLSPTQVGEIWLPGQNWSYPFPQAPTIHGYTGSQALYDLDPFTPLEAIQASQPTAEAIFRILPIPMSAFARPYQSDYFDRESRDSSSSHVRGVLISYSDRQSSNDPAIVLDGITFLPIRTFSFSFKYLLCKEFGWAALRHRLGQAGRSLSFNTSENQQRNFTARCTDQFALTKAALGVLDFLPPTGSDEYLVQHPSMSPTSRSARSSSDASSVRSSRTSSSSYVSRARRTPTIPAGEVDSTAVGFPLGLEALVERVTHQAVQEAVNAAVQQAVTPLTARVHTLETEASNNQSALMAMLQDISLRLPPSAPSGPAFNAMHPPTSSGRSVFDHSPPRPPAPSHK